MLQNYLKVAIRAFFKNKSFSFINIAGLSIGISTCILITLYVLDELSFDRFHTNADRIYRVTELLHLPSETRHQAVTAPPMAPALERTFPEVQKSTRITLSIRNISYNDNKFNDTKIYYADSTLLQLFTFPMIAGDPNRALAEPYSIVLTENAAKKYFGTEDPINKIMVFSDSLSVSVTGVIKNVPSNSHIQFDAVISRSTIPKIALVDNENNWFANSQYSYILLPENYNIAELEAKVPAFLDKNIGGDRRTSGALWYDFVFQPLTSIHLHSTALYDIGVNGNIKYVYTFAAIAALVLLIACANYINLATAKSVNRAKELGMRKVIGARKKQLVIQLLGESCLVTFVAVLVSIALVAATLTPFNTLTGKQLSLDALLRPDVMLIIVAIFLMISLLAGSYPAFLMAGVSPLKTMKDFGRKGSAGGLVRKGLVVFQFTMSIFLMSATMVIVQQMEYMQTRNLGLHKEQVMQIKMPGRVKQQARTVRDELSKIPNVTSASVSSFTFLENLPNFSMIPEGAADGEVTSETVIGIDPDFIPNFDIQLIAGRNLVEGNIADDSSAFIVNEAAVKKFQWGTPEQAIGKNINWWYRKKGKVVGVVKDFNYSSLHNPIAPLIMHVYPEWYNYISLRIEGDNIQAVVKEVEAKWKQFDPESQLNYTFMDQDFQKLYRTEEQTSRIVGLLATLAIFIACLGLLGLAAYIAEQRTKEIGIRKVLGASPASIVALMSKDFMLLIGVAFIFAVPIASYASNQWLTSFAFRTEITLWIFIFSGVSAAVVAILTVSFQSIKASLMNPVKALRTE